MLSSGTKPGDPQCDDRFSSNNPDLIIIESKQDFIYTKCWVRINRVKARF